MHLKNRFRGRCRHLPMMLLYVLACADDGGGWQDENKKRFNRENGQDNHVMLRA